MIDGFFSAQQYRIIPTYAVTDSINSNYYGVAQEMMF